jgi:hypothetical protein
VTDAPQTELIRGAQPTPRQERIWFGELVTLLRRRTLIDAEPMTQVYVCEGPTSAARSGERRMPRRRLIALERGLVSPREIAEPEVRWLARVLRLNASQERLLSEAWSGNEVSLATNNNAEEHLTPPETPSVEQAPPAEPVQWVWAWGLAALPIVMAALVFISLVPKPAAPPEAAEAAAHILYPAADATVKVGMIPVDVQIDGLPGDQQLWTVIERDGFWWPQQRVIWSGGRGQGQARIGGGPSDHGLEMNLVLVAVGSDGDLDFERWLQRGFSNGVFPPERELPDGAHVVDQVRVVAE